MVALKDGRQSPVIKEAAKPLRTFSKEEWELLNEEEQRDFVLSKKQFALEALRNRITNPVAGLLLDLADLDVKLYEQGKIDKDKSQPISDDYVRALKLKVELAKAIKYVSKSDQEKILHEHYFTDKTANDLVIDLPQEDDVKEPSGSEIDLPQEDETNAKEKEVK